MENCIIFTRCVLEIKARILLRKERRWTVIFGDLAPPKKKYSRLQNFHQYLLEQIQSQEPFSFGGAWMPKRLGQD